MQIEYRVIAVIILHAYWQFFAYARMYVTRIDVQLCSGIKCMFFFSVSLYMYKAYSVYGCIHT